VEAFLENGLNVQLRHNPKETSWQDIVEHGYIAVLDADGKQLVRRDGFQHNTNLRRGGAFDMSAITAVVAEALAALPKEEEKLPSFIESTFTTKVEYERWIEVQKAEAGAGAPAA